MDLVAKILGVGSGVAVFSESEDRSDHVVESASRFGGEAGKLDLVSESEGG